MTEPRSAADKDELLRAALTKLKARIPDSAWHTSSTPFSSLRAECLILASDATFTAALSQYLKERTILRRAITSFFTHIAMAARARWDDAPEDMRPVVARGWFLGRWLPTFLVIDGPIGRFLFHATSPLPARLGAAYPILTAARDLLADKTFRTLRNGFAHWGFDWEVIGKDSFVVAYDWDRDLPTAKLHLDEADAFHVCAFALIETLDGILISGRALRPDAM